MPQRLINNDVVVLLFVVLALGFIAFLSIGATFSFDEAHRLLTSRDSIAWFITAGAAAAFMLTLLKERRRAVQERQTLWTFVNSAGEGIFAVDRQFRITLWNKSAESITGHAAADVVGRTLRDVVSFYRERDRAEDIVFIEEAMLYGKTRTMPEPMFLKRKDGTEVPVGDSAAPLTDSYGGVSGCIVVFRDTTTERKQQSLRSEFAYASHQLRTPVTKALWSLEASLGKPVPERKDLEIAYAALKSIRRMSSEIVDVSEIDQGIIHTKPARIVIRKALDEVLLEMEPDLKAREASVSFQELDATLAVSADPRLFRSILQELLRNAAMYSHSGGTIRASARVDGGFVIIEVSDDGIGIPADEQALVFTKFFRGGNVDTSSIPGAGLGLYVVRRYAELMTGKLWFTSTEGKGSVFSVQLPTAAIAS